MVPLLVEAIKDLADELDEIKSFIKNIEYKTAKKIIDKYDMDFAALSRIENFSASACIALCLFVSICCNCPTRFISLFARTCAINTDLFA